jgi:hypothetical protein
MKTLVTAIALSIALPAVAHAHEASETAKPMACCDKMKAEGKDCDCCKDMKKMDHSADGDAGAAGHADHSGSADTSQHQNH